MSKQWTTVAETAQPEGAVGFRCAHSRLQVSTAVPVFLAFCIRRSYQVNDTASGMRKRKKAFDAIRSSRHGNCEGATVLSAEHL